MTIPESYKIYFWDADWDELNRHPDRYKKYIITRLADKGDIEQVRWLFSRFGIKPVADMAAGSRRVSAKSRNFWKHVRSLL